MSDPKDPQDQKDPKDPKDDAERISVSEIQLVDDPAAELPKPLAGPRWAPRPPTSRDPDDREIHPVGDHPKHHRSPRAIAALALAIVGGVTIMTMIFLGHSNSGRFVITCDANRVVAEQGRSFPPWGTHPMPGAQWAPIQIEPESECKSRETDDEAELAGWYLDLLVDQATARLTARDVTDYEVASIQLTQALVLARAPERRDQRKDIERMLGDVDYWRAMAMVKTAATSLDIAAKQLDGAAGKRPRHVTDAATWAAHLRRVIGELHGGPTGAAASGPSGPIVPLSPLAPVNADHPAYGGALPVEGTEGASDGNGGGSGSNTAAPLRSPATPAPPGMPSGGVLL